MNKSGNEYLKIKLWKNIQIFSTFMKKKYSDIQYFHEEKNRGFEIFLFWAERISAFLQFRQLTKTSEKFALKLTSFSISSTQDDKFPDERKKQS